MAGGFEKEEVFGREAKEKAQYLKENTASLRPDGGIEQDEECFREAKRRALEERRKSRIDKLRGAGMEISTSKEMAKTNGGWIQ